MNTDLPQRWTPLRPHHIQQKLARREARFRVVVAGRRSGKTEIVGKRMLILSAIKAGMSGKYNNYKYVVAAPTREQVKRIYWKDLKDLIPNKFLSRPPQESTLEIDFYVGAHVNISLKGMDNPNRMEGESYDGVVLDEYGNMKAELLEENVMPTLSERGGWCDLIGVPEGRNHYYDTYKKACACTNGIWKAYHWCSSDILPAHEIDIARSNMDELMFQQEYEASFVTFTGRAYYPWVDKKHTASLQYDKHKDLIFAFDFNVEPGVAVVIQEQLLPNGVYGTGVIGEVYIPQNSSTESVCRKLISDWQGHEGVVRVYGDATGGARKTSALAGSDWDIIREYLRHAFRNRVVSCVPRSNPPEKSRVSAVNKRLNNMHNKVGLMVDPSKAPNLVKDLEGVRFLSGGAGEIDKRIDPRLTHISDALGYYIVKEFPVTTKHGLCVQRVRGGV